MTLDISIEKAQNGVRHAKKNDNQNEISTSEATGSKTKERC
jgi:hypothetical protein